MIPNRIYNTETHKILTPIKLAEYQIDEIINLFNTHNGEPITITCSAVDSNASIVDEIKKEMKDPSFSEKLTIFLNENKSKKETKDK